MPKRRIIRKSNKPLNIFVDGGDIQTPSAIDKASALSGNISAVGAGLSNMLGASMQNAQLADASDIENSIDQAQSYVVGANNNEDLLSEWGNYSPLEGVSWSDVRGGSTGQRLGNTLSSIGSGAGAGAAVGGLPGAIIGGVIGLGSAIGGWIAGDTKAKKQADAYNQQIKIANAKNLASLENRAANIDTQNDINAMAAYAADGGKIHIKKKNRGKFTAAAKRAGMGVQEYARHVLANKDRYSSTLVKRANFARNASKWKHADGGPLEEWQYQAPVFETGEPEPQQSLDFTGIKSTEGRAYDPDNINYIYNRLKDSYLSNNQISAILGSIIDESGGDPLKKSNTGKFQGLLQWSKERYKVKSDDPQEELDNQIDHILQTLINTSDSMSWTHGGEGSGYEHGIDAYRDFFNEDSSIDKLTSALTLGYVRPKGKHGSAKNRSKVATQVASIIGKDNKFNSTAVEALRKANASEANFVKRLKNPNREYIQDWENPDNIATHKLAYVTTDDGAIVFPEVAEVDGNLIDFTRVPYAPDAAIENALKTGDYVEMSPEEAEWYSSDNYKNYYPKFALGGSLTHGGNFSNGVTVIGNGGVHEENPFEGVPMGIAPDGMPNLVEEGEVKFNDYIFSNRLFATKDLLSSHNLPTSYANHSFADIAERMSKESSERPNDPISKRGLIDTMTKLQQAQEQLRSERQSRKYAKGGHLFPDGGIQVQNFPSVLNEDEDYLVGMPSPTANTISLRGNRGVEWPSPTTPTQGKDLSWLRYAPAIGSGLGVLSDALGITNKPDYGNADMIGNMANNLTEVDYTPIGNYLTYKPLDRNYYINKLNAQSGATRRAIINQSGGNRATAMAGLLAADYNAQGRLGDLARQAEEYNLAQRERVEAFNRGTNQFNSEMGLRAAIANQANDKLRLQAKTAQAQLRDRADMRSSAGRTANLTNLFDSLGDIGREETARNMISTNNALYYSIDRNGRIHYKNGYQDLSDIEKESVRAEAARASKRKSNSRLNYITIPNR